MRIFYVLICCLFSIVAQAASAPPSFVPVPTLSSHVIDQSKILSAKERGALDRTLADYETKTGSQLVVLLIDSTAPQSIEEFGIRAADTWKLGRKGIDDGVIIIVAKNNTKVLGRLGIEVGRGLEGNITDLQSKHILDDIVAPHFRNNDYYGGLTRASDALISLINQDPPTAGNKAKNKNNGTQLTPASFIIFFTLIGIIIALAYRTKYYTAPDGLAALGGFIIGSMLNQRNTHYGNNSSGGFGGGGFSGGGGGFSGGGGSFNGGGASGDW